jgi:glycerate kinase
MIFTSKDEIHDDYSTYMMIMAKYIKRNIFSAAPPGAGAAGAAGAALAGLLAGLVPGEKLAMGC